MTSEIALFPVRLNAPAAEALRIKSKLPSWGSVAKQVPEDLPGPNWIHAGLIDKISVAFAEVSRRAGRCRDPLYIATSTSAELFELGRLICLRRIGANGRELVHARELSAVSDSKLHSCREVVSRSTGRARRRWLRSQASPITEKLGPITIPGGTTLQAPSDDENAPRPPTGALSWRAPFDCF